MVARVLRPVTFAAIADAEKQAAVGRDRDTRAEMLALAGKLVHPEELPDVGQAALVFCKLGPHDRGAVAALPLAANVR